MPGTRPGMTRIGSLFPVILAPLRLRPRSRGDRPSRIEAYAHGATVLWRPRLLLPEARHRSPANFQRKALALSCACIIMQVMTYNARGGDRVAQRIDFLTEPAKYRH